MSKIKNPFLNNELIKNNSERDSGVKSTSATKIDGNFDNNIMSSSIEPLDGDNIMEIKKDSNLLKNIIVILIILLILTILGLVLWNFFNKNKIKPVDNKSREQEQKTIIETPSFEMSSDSFQASSVVVD